MTVFRLMLTLALTVAATTASAQTIGTFRWRTAPYCNVMFVTITQVGNFYRLEGYDEQCGNNPRQPLWGIGVPQANGTITFGVDQVMALGSVRPVAIRATISLASLSGTWEDSVGSNGAFEFSPTCTTQCGGPRPVPAAVDAPLSRGAGATADTLKAEIELLKQAVAALAVRKDD